MRQVTFSYPPADYNGIAATQSWTTSTGAQVILNGDLSLPLGQASDPTQRYAVVGAGIQRTIGIFSTGSLTGVVFYASGIDTTGRVITASFAGASGGSSTATDAFATFTAEFAQVNYIYATSAATSAFTIGTGATGSSRWVQTDTYVGVFAIGGTIDTATHCTVTPQSTSDNPGTTTSPTTFNHATGGVTADTQFSYGPSPVPWVRYIVTTNSATGVAVTMSYQQIGA